MLIYIDKLFVFQNAVPVVSLLGDSQDANEEELALNLHWIGPGVAL